MVKFRQELEKRLQNAREELAAAYLRRDKAEGEVRACETEVSALEHLIERETARDGDSPESGLSLADFVFKRLQESALTKKEVEEDAIKAGYFERDKRSPGRVIHLIITNMKGAKRIESAGKGRFQATNRRLPSLFVEQQAGRA